MRIFSYDVETTTFSKGNCFDSRNYMCLAGLYDGQTYQSFDVEYSKKPYREVVTTLLEEIDSCDLLVAFNAKFDLNWGRKYGLDYSNLRIWDCQLAHFIITNQTKPYPSLNDVAEYYGLGRKIDKIAEYWELGIQTDDIPFDELDEYLKQDVSLTLQIYFKQIEEIESSKPHLMKLIKVACMDTIVLADIEWNGLKYAFDVSKEKAAEYRVQLQDIDAELVNIYSIDGLNWNSNDHLSCILYGGVLKIPCREATQRVLKDGTIKYGERDGFQEIEVPRLVEPLKGSECAKEGFWKVGEDILANLKAKGKAKKIIELVTTRSLVDKQLNTYFEGIPKLYEEMHYEDEIVHGQLNQCVARTGRLSASRPNTQNFSDAIRECFISRY
jgi:DNA polymerase I-like protein with 3'-5' exonuclease and polymerase domains